MCRRPLAADCILCSPLPVRSTLFSAVCGTILGVPGPAAEPELYGAVAAAAAAAMLAAPADAAVAVARSGVDRAALDPEALALPLSCA